ncbi:MAG: DUF547 domain-containing protein [Desulfosarcinaceae bacterium]|nr:DUF547 domain-containing protein [Desulfosarcinaceae bacterium]
MMTVAKRYHHQRWIIPALLIPLLLGLAHIQAAAAVDNGIYGELLGRYVDNGHVDYKGLKTEEARLDAYLEGLSKVDPDTLSREARFAFYINAYNAWTLKLILTGYPGVDSIKDLGTLFSSPWKKKIAKIDGETLTLDQIEHDILRPEFKDARVHFAINCAALSCPPLQTEPFEAERLDTQLDEATIAFINRTDRTFLEGEDLHVSRIFKWFNEDFTPDVETFVRQYARGDLKQQLDGKKDVAVRYLDYDWSLNGS